MVIEGEQLVCSLLEAPGENMFAVLHSGIYPRQDTGNRGFRRAFCGWPRTAATLACAWVLCLASSCFHEPVVPENLYVREVTGEVFDTTPVRGKFLPLRNRRTGFEYKCSECHTDFESPTRQQEMVGEHAAIYQKFNHGMNTRCINCHHEKDRNAYVDHDGTPIPADRPARLCAKCHGPTYRDWEAGVHGRRNGYWMKGPGKKAERLLCVQCHDPHNPGFKPMIPDPPPPYSRFAGTPGGNHATEGDAHE